MNSAKTPRESRETRTKYQHKHPMNLLNLIVRNVRKPLVVAALGMAILSHVTHAATIKMECKVAAYSAAGWIDIRPGSNTGGRIQFDPVQRCYYTDRVSRGEPLRVTFFPSPGGEFAYWGYIAPDSIPSAWTGGFQNVWLPFSEVVACPVSPGWREVRAYVHTSTWPYDFSRSVPIGAR